MRFIIYGAGAVGGVIGARLFQSGHRVQLIARGPHLEAIRRQGLLFESPNESERFEIPAVGSPAELEFGPEDVVLLCMKSQHREAALLELAAAAGEAVPVICTQNGVENERAALRRFSHVYGMVVMLPAQHVEPGRVQSQSKAMSGILDAGLYPRGIDERIGAVTRALSESRFSAQPEPRIMRFKYAKLLMNLGNALQACSSPTNDSERELAGRLLRHARKEALACFEAAGIDCATAEEFATRRGQHIQPAPIQGSQRGGGSTWQSLARGQGSVEVDYLNGEIVMLGGLHEVGTPVNRTLQLATHALCRQGAAPGSLPIAELRDRALELGAEL